MFQFIRKHQAIGLIFIGIVIVSFVIFFSPNQAARAGHFRPGALGTIEGRAIERDEYFSAMKEARLTYFLRQGTWPGRSGRDWDESRETLDRLVLLNEAKRMGVVVADEVAAARILELPFLKDERAGGAFSRAIYDRFLAEIQAEGGLTRAEFEQFMRHEVTLEHLVNVGGLSGSLVTPREAEARFRSGNDRYSAQLVLFSASNYLASVNLNPTNIQQYYSNRLAVYRIPERLQVRYVKFLATNFQAEADTQLAGMTNLAQALDAQYAQRGADSFRDAANNVKPAAAAKEELKEEVRTSIALGLARKKANEFANRLYEMEANADSVTKLGTEMGLAVQTSTPFTQNGMPTDMRVNPNFSRQAFGLTADEPFATPFVGEDGVYVFAFERRIPSEIRPFKDVETSVIEAVKRTESRAGAEAAGQKFSVSASAGLAQGKTFEALATEAGLKTIVLTNFSSETKALAEVPARLTVSELLRVAGDLQAGKVGSFTPAGDGGFVMFLESRSPVAAETVKAEMPAFLTQQRQFGRFTAFMEWQRKRFAAAEVRLPNSGTSVTNAAPAAAK